MYFVILQTHRADVWLFSNYLWVDEAHLSLTLCVSLQVTESHLSPHDPKPDRFVSRFPSLQLRQSSLALLATQISADREN